jgi:hypothetical protein
MLRANTGTASLLSFVDRMTNRVPVIDSLVDTIANHLVPLDIARGCPGGSVCWSDCNGTYRWNYCNGYGVLICVYDEYIVYEKPPHGGCYWDCWQYAGCYKFCGSC